MFFPVISLIFELWSSLHILAASPFPDISIADIVFLLFQFLGGVFGSVNIFNFNKVQYINFYGYGYVLSTKSLPIFKS